MKFCISLCFVDGSSSVLGIARADSLNALAIMLGLGERIAGDRTESCGRFDIITDSSESESELEYYLWVEEVEEISSRQDLLTALENQRG